MCHMIKKNPINISKWIWQTTFPFLSMLYDHVMATYGVWFCKVAFGKCSWIWLCSGNLRITLLTSRYSDASWTLVAGAHSQNQHLKTDRFDFYLVIYSSGSQKVRYMYIGHRVKMGSADNYRSDKHSVLSGFWCSVHKLGIIWTSFI